MPNPASPADLAARWRPLSDSEEATGTVLLDDAWLMLKRRVVDLETKVADDVDFSAEAVRVLCAAVLRVMKNPDGKVQESVDDYSYTRDRSNASGELYFTDDEVDSLATTSRGRAFSFSILPTGYPDATFQ